MSNNNSSITVLIIYYSVNYFLLFIFYLCNDVSQMLVYFKYFYIIGK